MPKAGGMVWQPSSPELLALFEEIAPRGAGIVQKKMFGWPCCFFNGNLFVGLHKQSMIFRLSEADLAAFLMLDGAAEFEPMPGRKMRGYGILAEPLTRNAGMLRSWIERSLAYVRMLPAKKQNAAVNKKTATAKKMTAKRKKAQ